MGRTTNKQRRAAQADTARERAAAARAAQRQAEQRRRAISIIAGVVAIAVVVAVVAVIAITHKSKPKATAAVPAPSSVLQPLTSVSPATLDKIGVGTASVVPKSNNGKGGNLTNGGKPELLFIGGEFCPFCAAERWSMITALSRFGTFSNLTQITSSEENLPTFSFYKSSYTSKYLSFVPVENANQRHTTLQPLTPAQRKAYEAATGTSQVQYPFLDFGGKYIQQVAGYDETLLSGKTQAQVAAALKDPSSPLAKAIYGEANLLTAGLCGMTGNQPSSVCSGATISGIESKLGS